MLVNAAILNDLCSLAPAIDTRDLPELLNALTGSANQVRLLARLV